MHVADPDDYDPNLNVKPGYIAVSRNCCRVSRDAMPIDYTAGYDAADPAAVPMMIRMAILVGVARCSKPGRRAGGDAWRSTAPRSVASGPSPVGSPRLPPYWGLRGAHRGPGRGNHAG